MLGSMRAAPFLVVLFTFVLLGAVFAVDENNFKKCKDAGFCKRQRAVKESVFKVVDGSVHQSGGEISGELLNTDDNVAFRFSVRADDKHIGRLRIVEKTPLVPRYEVQDVLINEPSASLTPGSSSAGSTEATFGTNGRVRVVHDPFSIEWFIGEEKAVVVNSRNLLHFEHTREKPAAEEVAEGEKDLLTAQTEAGMWEETWKGTKDTKVHGPQSIGLDFTHAGAKHVYGIPEHADSFALEDTEDNEPFRLYNLDVFEYNLDSHMALYGTIPIMLAHDTKKTTAVFWLNAAETFVDVSMSADGMSKQSRWMSESGIIDVFFLMGPTPDDVFAQYSHLTGPTPLPPMFSIAYHQCRWNYKDEKDVAMVDAGFDEHDIPYDVLWLDIEHTNGKRYMTWDANKFPTPEKMQDALATKGRKMVTIVDPHFKRDNNYYVHSEAEAQGLYVKKNDGTTSFDGHCWPGSSSWLDVTAAKVRDFMIDKFSLSQYKGSTPNLHIWNDMNEPSVFNGPEITMPKDLKHDGGWEHRDVHNIYGFYYQMSTFLGLQKRSENKERPFVLSRAFFAGSHRYGAIWTGDNKAEWGHLEASTPMLLSHGVAGQVFIGADVGGFFGNPSAELLLRWYQAGAFQPFFRGHAHLDTKRREPWLFGEPWTTRIRDAIRTRYTYLPLLYTTFQEASKFNKPVMRPLWVEYPQEEATFAIEDSFLLGRDLLVRPVTAEGLTSVPVYLPGSEPWYDVRTWQRHEGGSHIVADAPVESIPVFQRGGSIVPRKDRARRDSWAMARDPYTLHVVLNSKGEAEGDLYLDDGHSYDYEAGAYVRNHFRLADGHLAAAPEVGPAGYDTVEVVERIVIVGRESAPNKVVTSDGRALEFTFANQVLTIRKPGVSAAGSWGITIA